MKKTAVCLTLCFILIFAMSAQANAWLPSFGDNGKKETETLIATEVTEPGAGAVPAAETADTSDVKDPEGGTESGEVVLPVETDVLVPESTADADATEPLPTIIVPGKPEETAPESTEVTETAAEAEPAEETQAETSGTSAHDESEIVTSAPETEDNGDNYVQPDDDTEVIIPRVTMPVYVTDRAPQIVYNEKSEKGATVTASRQKPDKLQSADTAETNSTEAVEITVEESVEEPDDEDDIGDREDETVPLTEEEETERFSEEVTVTEKTADSNRIYGEDSELKLNPTAIAVIICAAAAITAVLYFATKRK